MILRNATEADAEQLESFSVEDSASWMTEISEMVTGILTQWRWIEGMSELPGPFIYGITRTAQRSLL